MIKDVVIHNGLLSIATGVFVCMGGNSERGLRDGGRLKVAIPDAKSLLRQERFVDGKGCYHY
jgi:hypothetical protein